VYFVEQHGLQITGRQQLGWQFGVQPQLFSAPQCPAEAEVTMPKRASMA